MLKGKRFSFTNNNHLLKNKKFKSTNIKSAVEIESIISKISFSGKLLSHKV